MLVHIQEMVNRKVRQWKKKKQTNNIKKTKQTSSNTYWLAMGIVADVYGSSVGVWVHVLHRALELHHQA